MRTLAFAYAVLPPGTPADEDALHARQDTLESGLVFIGVAAIRIRCAPDVKAAVEECRRAGIEVKMITGDNVETARAIAGDVGLIARDAAIDTPDGPVLTSAALEALERRRVEGTAAEACAWWPAPGRWTSTGWSRRCKRWGRWWPSPATAPTMPRR